MGTGAITVFLPAYNESAHIGGILVDAYQFTNKITVVDDGSTDSTAQVAESLGATVIINGVNQGYGYTIQRILREARSIGTDISVIMDSDGQHSPSDIPALVDAIRDGYDLAIGCRSDRDIPKMRRVGGLVLRIATRILSGVNVKDSQCGFRAYSRWAVRVIEPKESGMAVSSEIVALASWARLKIIEVPISVRYTDDSSTHNPWRQGFYTLWRILVMLLREKIADIEDWMLARTTYVLRSATHWARMKQIKHGRDWRFYTQYSVKEILQMKLDGTEEDKYWAWLHRM